FANIIGLEGKIDGLVHLSDISWEDQGEEAVREYKKGEEIETVILSIDPERERISLGIKQLEDDPFVNYVAEREKGSIVKGTITSVDAKSATVTLTEGVEGTLRASEISREKVEDVRSVLNEGDEIEVKIVSVDRKNRVLSLSVKAIEIDDEKAAVADHKNQESGSAAPATIGDLIKAQLDKK
ncbi:MAG: S1 RNA-binding domain-containing protein, partial [Pseudohongiellaceae bacterium]